MYDEIRRGDGLILCDPPQQNQLYCAGYQSEIQTYFVAQGDNYHFFTFWHRSIEESFLYTKICFVASRTLYLLSYGSKKSTV